ncbi:MAG: hypothetical protein K2X82_03530 [Gemmataceae bacterium]|nr:hypothetical protein [Gemmataceae bacterium]
MKRLALPGPACALALTLGLAGCGPMRAPLPDRLDDETQKKVDESWDRAFTPPGRFDHQGLLDLMVVARPYQIGVDELSFRSAKRFAGGTAVMEVRYDRAKPGDDLFAVTVTDPAGKVIRAERYTRAEVRATVEEFNQTVREPAEPDEPPGVAARRARLKRIQDVFPPEKKD